MGRHNLLLKTRSFHRDHMCRIMFAAIATSDNVSFHNEGQQLIRVLQMTRSFMDPQFAYYLNGFCHPAIP